MVHALPARGRRAIRWAAGVFVAAALARVPRSLAAGETATRPPSAASSFAAPVSVGGRLPRIDARGAAIVPPRLVQGPAGAALLGPRSDEPEAIAAGFASRALAPAGLLGHVSTVTGGGGVRFVTLEQRFDGIPVALGRVTVAVAPDGSVLAARVGELAPAAPPAPSSRPAVADAAVARRLALESLAEGDPAGGLAGEAEAERVVVPLAGTSTWGWRVRLGRPGRPEERYEVLLAEADGRLLRRESITFPGIDAARVFPRGPLQPAAWRSFPDPARRPSVDSPRGWCDADQTAGNNTWVQLDREGDFFPPFGASATASGNPPVLDFPFTGDPAQDVDLALTNVFWAINDSHDHFRRLGFDEPSGAMQDDGYGRGGRASDRVWALVQYATQDGTQPYANVGLGTGPDGSFTYMVVGVFDTGSGLRDGALDTSLLIHEYAHGVSTRLAGDDPACFGGVQPQALSEGWSDFFAASFTGDPVIGAWSSANATSGQRQASLDANPFTFSNLCADGCNRFNDGEIWSGALWDLRQELARNLGPAAGVDKAERLVVEGLRYTPCRATFPEARDAILLADAALFAGADRCALWSVFANRGIGWSTQTAGPDDARPLAAYDLPPECSGGQAAWFDQDEYATDAAATVSVVDGGGVAGTTVTVRTARGDSVTAPLVPAGTGPLRRASFRLVPGPVVAGDGLLQVNGADALTATCDGPGTTAAARVTDGIPLTVINHYVYSAWCQAPDRDDDHPDGWYNLSGFLDAGEIANVVVTLGSGTGADAQDASVLVTSLNPDVRVLPSVAEPVGTIERQRGTAPRPFTFEFRAEGSPRIVPGETADIRFDVTARGRSGSVILTMTLDEDYVVVNSVSPFDAGVETFEPSSSTAAAWTHQAWRGALDEWRIDACAGNGASSGYEVAQPPCLPYVDGQVATALVSPPSVPLPPDAVAIRWTDFSWDDSVDLWTDPANPYCDADVVALYVTADPATLPFDDPQRPYDYDPQRVWLFRDNTAGFTHRVPYGLDRSPQYLTPGLPYDRLRLAWIFWGDVYDCGFETANEGTYRLDNVRLTYDVVRQVPETTPCALDCDLRTFAVPVPAGPKCPGEPFAISAAGTEALGCTGPIRLSFSGSGVPAAFNWTYETESPAAGADGATYAVYAQCENNPDCNDYRQFVNVSPAQPGVGGAAPDSLRVRRDTDDLVFSWRGAALPPAYGIFRATSRAELAAGIATWPLQAAVDGEGPGGEGSYRSSGGARTGGLEFFQVCGRDPCTGAARLP